MVVVSNPAQKDLVHSHKFPHFVSEPRPQRIQHFQLGIQSLRKLCGFCFFFFFQVIQTHIKCLLLHFSHLNI